jgi:glycosyltransferase involved in cell wall biosynthesis
MTSPVNPLVTIGIPAFNSEKTISAAIESVLQQDYENLEVIVSDNFSTDSTLDICESFKKSDPRVTVLAQSKNIGAVSNFKFLLERANGAYFCWLGSDDRFAPEHIGLSVGLLREDSDLIGCMAQAIFDFEISTEIKPQTYHFSTSSIQRIREFFRNPGRSHGLFYGLYKVENLRTYRFLSREFFAWDWCLILHLLAQGKIGGTEKLGLISGSKGVSSSNLVYKHYGISGFKRLLPYSMFTRVTWSNLNVWSKGARVYLVYCLIRINLRYLLLERFEVKHWIKTRISYYSTGGSK